MNVKSHGCQPCCYCLIILFFDISSLQLYKFIFHFLFQYILRESCISVFISFCVSFYISLTLVSILVLHQLMLQSLYMLFLHLSLYQSSKLYYVIFIYIKCLILVLCISFALVVCTKFCFSIMQSVMYCVQHQCYA